MPCQERLVSLFIEELLHHELHATLYIKHHKIIKECIRDAIEFDDNCKRALSHERVSMSATFEVISATYVEEVIKALIERIYRCQIGLKYPWVMGYQKIIYLWNLWWQ